MANRFLVPFLVFVGAGAYYFTQACPTFYFWDSAELTAAVLTGGVPHPPGFPFFLLLAKGWNWFFSADPAYALNLFSVFFAALGLALWYSVIIRMFRKSELIDSEPLQVFMALAATLVIGVSLTYSIQATRFEVYSLNFCGFAALALVAMKIGSRQGNSGFWYLIFFILMGLLLGVHNLTIALAIPGILMILLLGKRIWIGPLVVGLLGAMVIAALLYLTIPDLAGANPALNWGDPSDFKRFLEYVLVRGFSTSAHHLSLGHIIDEIGFVIMVLSKQVGLAGLILSTAALIFMLMRRTMLALPFLAILVLNSLSVAFGENYFYENYDLHGYLTISLGVVILFLAVGLALVFRLIVTRLEIEKVRASRAWGLLLTAIVAVLVILPPARTNFRSADLSQVGTARSFAQQFLETAPRNSVILTSSYNTYFCLLAYQAAYDHDRDNLIINIYNWDHPWGKEQTNRTLNCDLPADVGRQTYYRDFINHFMVLKPLYVEYDESSGPVAQYLRPLGPGYLFSLADTSLEVARGVRYDISSHLKLALKTTDIESIRTWVLWFQQRGEYYQRRHSQQVATEYFSAVDLLASKARIE